MVILIVLLWGGIALAAEGGVHILFDQGHDQRFLIEGQGDLQLSRLAGIMRGQRNHVTSTIHTLNDDTLKDSAALVISGPFEALRPEEVEAVARFVEKGGRLAVMLHIGSPLAGLLSRLDLDSSTAVLHERSGVIDADTNFRVSDLSGSPLFTGLTHFSVYGCWALDQGKVATAIAKTSSGAWADLDGNKILSKGDVIGSFAVVVSGEQGAGAFVVFGDDAIFQNRYLDEHNSRLAANLAGWLAGR